MFNFILVTEDNFKIISYAWLPMVVWPLLTAQTIRHALSSSFCCFPRPTTMGVCCMIGKLCNNKTVIIHTLRWLRVAYCF